MDVDILVACGRGDPNTGAILAAAEARGVTVCEVIPDAEGEPAVTWDPVSGALTVDGAEIGARGIFLRYDVFGPGGYQPDQGRADRALAWFSTMCSWAYADPGLRFFNREGRQSAAYKGFMLSRAAALGLPLPETRLTNARAAVEAMGPPERLIAKPAGGGAFTSELGAAFEPFAGETAPAPAIVQERLGYPEVRVYLVGGVPFVFETHATTLDFRADQRSATTYLPPERLRPELLAGLRRLAGDLRLDFCAFDLKTRESAGELCFLEVNSGPMFSAFDALTGGALAGAMVDWLSGRSAAGAMAAE